MAATSGVGVEGLCGVERRSCVGLAVMPTVSKSHELSKSERIARIKPRTLVSALAKETKFRTIKILYH